MEKKRRCEQEYYTIGMIVLKNKWDNIKPSKKKVCAEDFEILDYNEYNDLMMRNYNMDQLKKIAKKYKQKVSGNKQELCRRLYNYLYYSHNSIMIQKNIRRHFIKKYIELHGPGFKNKNKCVNQGDFITFENLKDITFTNFMSYQEGETIYGFDISSLYSMWKREKRSHRNGKINYDNLKNPYTQLPIPKKIFNQMKQYIRISNVLNIELNLNSYEEENEKNNALMEQENNIENVATSLFHHIDNLGNYTHVSWFMNLNTLQLIKFIRELGDIWNYRAQLDNETKMNICSPNGNPFAINSTTYSAIVLSPNMGLDSLRRVILMVMENMTKKGINEESSKLGCFYVLSALTLVSEEAATALPWLYESVAL